MKHIVTNERIKSLWKTIKPWAIYIGIFLILRFTGILAGVSYLANVALMETGVMDASVKIEDDLEKKFNYNFTIKDLNGNKIDVNELKGKTIFLNLWATWCGPCRVEMPSIQNLYNQVDHDKIVFILLSIDHRDALNKVTNFIREKDYTFPVYIPDGHLTPQLQVPSIPTTFVISPEGKIVSKEVGAANYETEKFKKFLEAL